MYLFLSSPRSSCWAILGKARLGWLSESYFCLTGHRSYAPGHLPVPLYHLPSILYSSHLPSTLLYPLAFVVSLGANHQSLPFVSPKASKAVTEAGQQPGPTRTGVTERELLHSARAPKVSLLIKAGGRTELPSWTFLDLGKFLFGEGWGSINRNTQF